MAAKHSQKSWHMVPMLDSAGSRLMKPSARSLAGGPSVGWGIRSLHPGTWWLNASGTSVSSGAHLRQEKVRTLALGLPLLGPGLERPL